MIDLLEPTKIENEQQVDLSFSFHAEPKTSLNTNFSEENAKNDVQVILMCVNNDYFKCEKSYELKLLGKSMKDWLMNAVKDFPVKCVEMHFQDDFMPIVKQNINLEKKYTLVLFSDAPLVRTSTINQVLEYFIIKDLSVLKLTRGYMFKTDYLNTIDKLYNPQMQYFEEEDFITAYNLKQFALIGDILKSRIISYHQKNGVIIYDPVNTIIDANVSIEEGVKIYSGNKILGGSVIEKDVVLSFNNVIDNAVIMANSFIASSIVKNSIIGKNCTLENFSIVEKKSVVGDNTKLKGFNVISGKQIASNVELEFYEKKM